MSGGNWGGGVEYFWEICSSYPYHFYKIIFLDLPIEFILFNDMQEEFQNKSISI